MVRYYCSQQGGAQEKNKDQRCPANEALAPVGDNLSCILEPELTGKAFRKNWSLLMDLHPYMINHRYLMSMIRIWFGFLG
jgi:hypothetical protein